MKPMPTIPIRIIAQGLPDGPASSAETGWHVRRLRRAWQRPARPLTPFEEYGFVAHSMRNIPGRSPSLTVDDDGGQVVPLAGAAGKRHHFLADLLNQRRR